MPPALLTPIRSGVQIHISEPRKNRVQDPVITWLGLGDGNITFSDELDFDPSELDIVYQDGDMEQES